MNGNAFFLDTNAVISLLRGEESLLKKVVNATWLGLSIITVIEFNSFKELTDEDHDLFKAFCNEVIIVELSFEQTTLLDEIYLLRREKHLKTPDAIIVASAKVFGAILLTRDKKLLDLKFDYIQQA